MTRNLATPDRHQRVTERCAGLTPTRRRVVLVVMCVAYFLVLLDVTIVNVALPHIASGLHAGVSGLQWVVDGYALALAALMLAGGTVGDLRGHKRVVLIGLTLFGVASVGCALAPSVGLLAGVRVVQGVGAALMLPGTLAVISDTYTEESERARAIGVWAGIGSAALPAGPLLGGVLTQAVSWRAVFVINVPIVLIALVVAMRAVPESGEREGRRIDAAGVVLGGTLLATITFAFIQAGHSGPSAPVVIAGVAAIVLSVAFISVERSRHEPMLPPTLFRRPTFTTANAVAGTMNLASLGLLFVLTLYLQDLRHDSALSAGLTLLPLFLPLSILAPLAGRVTSRAGPRWPMTAGLCLAAGGCLLLAFVGAHSAALVLLVALLLWGIGLAFLTPSVVAAAIAAVPEDRSGFASAVNNTSRQASGAIGIAAFGSLAGAPASSGFVSGFHAAALVAVGLFAVAALATVKLIP